MASTFRDLRVWQEAMELTVQVYKSTAVFPKLKIMAWLSRCSGLRFRSE